MPYIGKQPSKVPLDSSDIADGTITNDDLAGSITSAKITSLDATKLTGTVASARMGSGTASSSTVLYGDGTYKAEPVTDTTSIKNDISLLALQTAINGNMTAFGLKNSFIEQFENSTFIENLSSALRNSAEYISTGTATSTIWPYTNYADQVFTHNGFTDINGSNSSSTTHTVAKNVTSAMLGWSPSPSGFTNFINFDYLANYTWTGCKIGFQNTNGHINTWRLETSTDGSSYSILDMTGATSAALSGYDLDNGDNLAITTDATGLVTNTTNGGNLNVHGGEITFGTPVTTRHLRITVGSYTSNSDSDSGIDFFVPTYEAVTSSATGSFNSTDVVPQDAVNKSSVGLVVLYKDNGSSSCTLNTDIVAKVRANTGQAYQTLVLASAGTYSDSLKIAIAPAISVTAGQALSYEISFANQSSGTKEARIYGVAMTY
jgi:hypothetical protein